QASLLGISEYQAGDIHFSRNQLELLQQVTVQDVQRVANVWLTHNQSLTLTLNPASMRHQFQSRASTAPAEVTVEQGCFSNGLRWVVLPDDHLPLATMAYMGKGGCYGIPRGQEGVSSLTATLLAKDTQHRSAEQIVRAVESVAGHFY